MPERTKFGFNLRTTQFEIQSETIATGYNRLVVTKLHNQDYPTPNGTYTVGVNTIEIKGWTLPHVAYASDNIVYPAYTVYEEGSPITGIVSSAVSTDDDMIHFTLTLTLSSGQNTYMIQVNNGSETVDVSFDIFRDTGPATPNAPTITYPQTPFLGDSYQQSAFRGGQSISSGGTTAGKLSVTTSGGTPSAVTASILTSDINSDYTLLGPINLVQNGSTWETTANNKFDLTSSSLQHNNTLINTPRIKIVATRVVDGTTISGVYTSTPDFSDKENNPILYDNSTPAWDSLGPIVFTASLNSSLAVNDTFSTNLASNSTNSYFGKHPDILGIAVTGSNTFTFTANNSAAVSTNTGFSSASYEIQSTGVGIAGVLTSANSEVTPNSLNNLTFKAFSAFNGGSNSALDQKITVPVDAGWSGDYIHLSLVEGGASGNTTYTISSNTNHPITIGEYKLRISATDYLQKDPKYEPPTLTVATDTYPNGINLEPWDGPDSPYNSNSRSWSGNSYCYYRLTIDDTFMSDESLNFSTTVTNSSGKQSSFVSSNGNPFTPTIPGVLKVNSSSVTLPSSTNPITGLEEGQTQASTGSSLAVAVQTTHGGSNISIEVSHAALQNSVTLSESQTTFTGTAVVDDWDNNTNIVLSATITDYYWGTEVVELPSVVFNKTAPSLSNLDNYTIGNGNTMLSNGNSLTWNPTASSNTTDIKFYGSENASSNPVSVANRYLDVTNPDGNTPIIFTLNSNTEFEHTGVDNAAIITYNANNGMSTTAMYAFPIDNSAPAISNVSIHNQELTPGTYPFNITFDDEIQGTPSIAGFENLPTDHTIADLVWDGTADNQKFTATLTVPHGTGAPNTNFTTTPITVSGISATNMAGEVVSDTTYGFNIKTRDFLKPVITSISADLTSPQHINSDVQFTMNIDTSSLESNTTIAAGTYSWKDGVSSEFVVGLRVQSWSQTTSGTYLISGQARFVYNTWDYYSDFATISYDWDPHSVFQSGLSLSNFNNGSTYIETTPGAGVSVDIFVDAPGCEHGRSFDFYKSIDSGSSWTLISGEDLDGTISHTFDASASEYQVKATQTNDGASGVDTEVETFTVDGLAPLISIKAADGSAPNLTPTIGIGEEYSVSLDDAQSLCTLSGDITWTYTGIMTASGNFLTFTTEGTLTATQASSNITIPVTSGINIIPVEPLIFDMPTLNQVDYYYYNNTITVGINHSSGINPSYTANFSAFGGPTSASLSNTASNYYEASYTISGSHSDVEDGAVYVTGNAYMQTAQTKSVTANWWKWLINGGFTPPGYNAEDQSTGYSSIDALADSAFKGSATGFHDAANLGNVTVAAGPTVSAAFLVINPNNDNQLLINMSADENGIATLSPTLHTQLTNTADGTYILNIKEPNIN